MNKSQKLVDSIIKGIQDKKGSGIVVADLTQTDGAVCSYFIICQGNSPTQVEAIAGSVGDYVREAEGEKPVSCIGLGLAQWVAIDFVDVMVHIFEKSGVLNQKVSGEIDAQGRETGKPALQAHIRIGFECLLHGAFIAEDDVGAAVQ